MTTPINKCIYMLWLGNEELNANRLNAINNMPYNTILITQDNLHQYIKINYPLHPAYQSLSTVHKSDYMRCYLMHHYGGGYSDIKYTNINWENAFTRIDVDTTIELMGVKTTHGHTYAGIELWSDVLKTNILNNIESLVCMGYMVCRPYSSITTKWYTELHLQLDNYLELLQLHPAQYTRECYDPHLGYAMTTPKWEGISEYHSMYPISWNYLLSQILYPIQLEYMDKIDNTIMIHIL